MAIKKKPDRTEPRPPLFPKLGRPKKELPPKIYLRRLIGFENRLLAQLIKDPAERKLATRTMSLLNTAYFYDYSRFVKVSEFRGFLDGISVLMHNPETFKVLESLGTKREEFVEWLEKGLDKPMKREKDNLRQLSPNDKIPVTTGAFIPALEAIFNKILKRNGVYEKYNAKLEESKTLQADLRAVRKLRIEPDYDTPL